MKDAIKISGLKKSYGSKLVLGGLDFQIKQGEIFALLGVNGAGKTTTLECIEGLREYDEGKIVVNGKTGIQLQSSSLPVHIKPMEAIKLFAKWNHTHVDDVMLKNGRSFGQDYFKELLERVRSIRASERRIWQKITDIFAECSIDYDKNSDITKDFYATIQNKFHYAIVGKTAPEIIYNKADNTKENMGLTNWKNSPNGRILKTDVIVAKNYLELDEIKRLERLVVGYFDYIEDVIERENTFTMEEFATSVNEFLEFRKYQVLKDKGKISKRQAIEKAEKEYDIFNKTQKIESDFDKQIENLKRGKI